MLTSGHVLWLTAQETVSILRFEFQELSIRYTVLRGCDVAKAHVHSGGSSFSSFVLSMSVYSILVGNFTVMSMLSMRVAAGV